MFWTLSVTQLLSLTSAVPPGETLANHAAAGAAREHSPLMEPFQLLRNCYAFVKAAPHPPAPYGFRLSADQELITKVCSA